MKIKQNFPDITKTMSREEELFQAFRPYCSALASKPSLPILERLKELVQHSNHQPLSQIQEYIVFPMQLYLRKPTMPENYTLAVLNFLSFFYTKATLSSKFVLKDIIESTLTLSMKLEKPSEDFKVAFAKLIASLFKSAHDLPEMKKYFYEDDLKLPLSHIVFQLLDWGEQDEARDVIFAILDALDAMIVEPNYDNEAVIEAYVERFAQMLPGSTTKIVKIMKRNYPSQGHKIKTQCLNLWTKLVISIVNDENIQLEPSLETKSNQLLSDPQWVGNACDHLFQHMQIFLSLALNPHVNVRQALHHLCSKLMMHSRKNLSNTRPIQVRMYFTLFDYSLQNLLRLSEEKETSFILMMRILLKGFANIGIGIVFH